MQRRSWQSRWSRRLAVFSAVLLTVSIFSHRNGVVDAVSLFWLVGLAAILAMLAFGFAIKGLQDIWRDARDGSSDAFLGMMISIAVLSPYVLCFYNFFAYPTINDVSTDWSDPPRLAAAGSLRDGSMNEVEAVADLKKIAAQEVSYPEVTGRRYDVEPSRMVEIVLKMVVSRGWTVLEISRPAPNATTFTRDELQETTIEATASSPILGLASDVAIRVTDEGSTSYVDMRSSSRYGLHDLGTNARRIIGFLTDLDSEIALQAGLEPEESPDTDSDQVPIPTPSPAE